MHSCLQSCFAKTEKSCKNGVPDVSEMDSFSPGGRMPTSLSEDTEVYVAIKLFCTNGSVYGAIDKYCKNHNSEDNDHNSEDNDIPCDCKELLNVFQAKFEYVSKKKNGR
eukprot:17192-Karenia_brevis.AAC.1